MSARDVEEIYRANPPHPVTSRALNLRLHPDPVLRTVCYPMERFDQWLSDVVDEMLSLMRIHDGIGLAAPQVGITKRFFVAQIGRRSICLANPVLVGEPGSDQMTERVSEPARGAGEYRKEHPDRGAGFRCARSRPAAPR